MSGKAHAAEPVPWRRIVVLGAGVVAVFVAGVQATSLAALLLVVLGLALLAAALLLERRRNHCFRPIRSICGGRGARAT
jgi:Flp pilus assembly protein TadB